MNKLIHNFRQFKEILPTDVRLEVIGFDWTRDRKMNEFQGVNILAPVPIGHERFWISSPLCGPKYDLSVIFCGHGTSENRKKLFHWWNSSNERPDDWLIGQCNYWDNGFNTSFGLDLK